MFVEQAAVVFAYLNQAHPFREGNGRTAKLFMDHVAAQSRFEFDYTRVSPQVWNQRSMLSGPDAYDYPPHPQWLVPVFEQITVNREVPSATDRGDPREQEIEASPTQAPYRSLDYPHPPTTAQPNPPPTARLLRPNPGRDRPFSSANPAPDRCHLPSNTRCQNQ